VIHWVFRRAVLAALRLCGFLDLWWITPPHLGHSVLPTCVAYSGALSLRYGVIEWSSCCILFKGAI